MSETNAVKWLRAQNIHFELLEYNFTKVGAESAAQAVGKSLEETCKTLIVEATGKKYWAAIIPGDQRFDTKKMATAISAAKADLADNTQAEKISGYQVGGISPFAMRRKLPTIIEESLLALDTIVINGGKRGTLLEIKTEDVVELLQAQQADICK